MTDRFKALEGDTAGAIAHTEDLPEISATAAGLKALITFMVAQGIEDCRKCCGGNGYLLSSGIGQLEVDFKWQTTAEGDWIILQLQTARFLMKSLKAAREGKPAPGPCAYMAVLKDPKFDAARAAPPAPKTLAEMCDPEYLLRVLKHRALVDVIAAGEQLAAAAPKLGEEAAWNANAVELVAAVRVHCLAFMMEHFVGAVRNCGDAAVKAVLGKVAALYGCSTILEEGYFGGLPAHMRLLRGAVSLLLDQLRPEAVALVDSFDIEDNVLMSNIGRKDGNVYEALFESALQSKLNQSDPVPGFSSSLLPHLDTEYLTDGAAAARARM
jgi:acyl-CoA oxidase